MPYYFFFSYARANSDDYLKKFFDDLSDKIRELVGLSRSEQVGFFDQKDLDLGAEWDQELARALQTSPVMISLYSPAYFNSTYCGKEWECIRQRRQLYADRLAAAGVANPELPPVIKPVIWIPLRPGQRPPEAVRGPQYLMGDPADVHNATGLKTMRKQYANFETAYDAFILRLAQETLDAIEQFSLPPNRQLSEWLTIEAPANGLPPLEPWPALNEVRNAFESPAQQPEGPPIAPSRRRGGPKFVRFVVVAAAPDEFQRARRREFYLQFGGIEWKPYLPDVPRSLMSLAQIIAGELDIFSDELPFNQNLAQEVRNAEDNNSLVVMFVDGWTAEIPAYREVLEVFDRNLYKNCSIFIPWNYKDPETASRGDQLKQIVRNHVFPRWSRFATLNEPIYFCDSIGSVEDLRDRLQTTLAKLQLLIGKDVIEHATRDELPRSIPTDIGKPILSHKSEPKLS